MLVVGHSLPAEITESLVDYLEQNGNGAFVVHKPSGEPFSSEVDDAFQGLPTAVTAVIGLGGGSAMDFAKTLAILIANGGHIADYEFGERQITRGIPLYQIPTTCGSGSEMTQYCVVNNSRTKRKFTLAHPNLIATESALDPGLLAHLPTAVRLASSLDAFVHCLEAILTRTDARLIEPLAVAGLRIAWNEIPKVAAGDLHPSIHDNLAMLAMYGGISIAHSRTGLIHTISVALSEFCDVPHGKLNSLILPAAVKSNVDHYDGQLARVMGQVVGRGFDNDPAAFDCLVEWLSSVIDIEPPFDKSVMLDNRSHIIERIFQDKGLPAVNHGPVEKKRIVSVLGELFNAN